LNTTVKKAIDNGEKSISVSLRKGRYYYDRNHLYLQKLNAPDVSITIKGNGSTLIPKGKDYRTGDDFKGLFNTDWAIVGEKDGTDISCWSRVFYAESRVEEVRSQKDLWRIKCAGLVDKSNKQCTHTFMLLTCWFKSFVLKVEHIEDGYLYFISDNHNYNESFHSYDLDYDYGYGKRFARFKLCNYNQTGQFRIDDKGKVISDEAQIHVCDGGSFLKIHASQLGRVRVTGISFLGASSMADQTSLIGVSSSGFQMLRFDGNRFVGIHNIGINLIGVSNVVIENNMFRDCYKTLINADNTSNNIRVVGNVFVHCGLRMNQDYCASIYGSDYSISNNVFCDFGYSAIRIGVWHGHIKKNLSKGVVENNEIFCTKDYLQDIDNYGLMDGGAIYVATQNDGAIIRYNYIHDIGGIKDNRGIFCDDGACNYSLYGNVIVRISNSYCIDAPRSVSVERNVGMANIGNVIRDNIVDGEIRFAGRENTINGCEYGTNYFLTNEGDGLPRTTLKNVSITGEAVVLTYTGEKNGRIGVSSNSYKRLKKCSEWKRLKGRFVRKNS